MSCMHAVFVCYWFCFVYAVSCTHCSVCLLLCLSPFVPVSFMSPSGAPQPTAEVSPSWSSADLSAADATYGPHLSILCLNAFLIPPFVSWNPYLWAPFWSCKRPNERAEQVCSPSQVYRHLSLFSGVQAPQALLRCIGTSVSS